MDMFQIDWWHQEVDKMEKGFQRENVEYISTFFKNVNTAIEKIKYGAELRKRNAERKYEEAFKNGASQKVLKMIERSGKQPLENQERLAKLEELMKRFVNVQVANLDEVISEYQFIGKHIELEEDEEIKLDALQDLKRQICSSPYYGSEKEDSLEKE